MGNEHVSDKKMTRMHTCVMRKGRRIVGEQWDVQHWNDRGRGGPASYLHAIFVLHGFLLKMGLCNTNCHSLSGRVVNGCGGGGVNTSRDSVTRTTVFERADPQGPQLARLSASSDREPVMAWALLIALPVFLRGCWT